LVSTRFAKNLVSLASQFTATASRRFESHKRRQFFIRTHNEALIFKVFAEFSSSANVFVRTDQAASVVLWYGTDPNLQT